MEKSGVLIRFFFLSRRERIEVRMVLVAFLLLAVPLQAEDFKLTTGAEYKNVKVSRVEPDGIVIATDYGVVKLFFAELPKEVQEKYHYDPKAAEAFRFRLDAARDAAKDEVEAAKQRETERNAQSTSTSGAPDLPSETTNSRLLKSLSLSAHEIGTADSYQSRWEGDWGSSYDRSYTRGKRILVTIRDTSRKVPKVQVDVYFVARPVLDPATHFIYDHRRLFPHLRGRIEINGPVAAVDLHARMVNLSGLGGPIYGKGADMDGWIAIGSVDDHVFGIAASSRTLEAIAREDPSSPERLSDLVNGYRKARH